MKVLLCGATGMVGQGVLRECLLDPAVEQVTALGRNALGQQHAKLHEILHADLFDLAAIEDRLRGYDACFFCLGVSSAGMKEADYAHITYDLTIGVAATLVRLNPGMTFVYVSGAGTDSSEHGRVMWARVKGRTENALLNLPFKAAYMFRPGAIQPLHGIRSKTALYQVMYVLLGWLVSLLRPHMPKYITTTEQLGKAMLWVVKKGASKRVLESVDINEVRES